MVLSNKGINTHREARYIYTKATETKPLVTTIDLTYSDTCTDTGNRNSNTNLCFLGFSRKLPIQIEKARTIVFIREQIEYIVIFSALQVKIRFSWTKFAKPCGYLFHSFAVACKVNNYLKLAVLNLESHAKIAIWANGKNKACGRRCIYTISFLFEKLTAICLLIAFLFNQNNWSISYLWDKTTALKV